MPRGTITTPFALGLTLAFLVIFLGSAWKLNDLAFRLAPAVIPFLVGYPYTKRFTWTCHFWLGLPFGVAPMGGWIAVTGTFPMPLETPVPWLLAFASGLWVAGFDILYALLDVTFDRGHRLHSMPADFGETVALRVSEFLHLNTWLLLGAVWFFADVGAIYVVGWGVVGALLMYEHVIVNPDDERTIHKAFFTMNGLTSFAVLATVTIDLLLA
jgi:4-hydroxybenzoate polyprenyltransferase